MSSTDKVYIVSQIEMVGPRKRGGIITAVCKTPREAVIALNPFLKEVSVKVVEKDGITVFETASRGDVLVIDLALLHQARCVNHI